MARIYISSTYSDLKEYRENVYQTLRRMQHDAVAMEDYVATGQHPPLDKCLADVAKSDLYVGIFAWRYGYIPDEGNPQQKSITELEYRQAQQLGKPCFIFLLHEDAPWLPKFMDKVTGDGEGGKRIEELRQELSTAKLVSFFKTPDKLANLVAVAVQQWEQEPVDEQPKSQAENKRNKTQQALLDWVKNEVESRLKNSLHNRVSILLEKEEDPTKVNHPWAIDVKIGTRQPFR